MELTNDSRNVNRGGEKITGWAWKKNPMANKLNICDKMENNNARDSDSSCPNEDGQQDGNSVPKTRARVSSRAGSEVEVKKKSFCEAMRFGCNIQVFLVYLACILIGIYLLILTFEFTSKVQFMMLNPFYTFVLLPISLLYICMFVAYLLDFINLLMDPALANKNVNKRKRKGGTSKCNWLLAFKSNFNITGKYFIFKLHISEIFEHGLQTFNLFTFYFCEFQPEVCMVLVTLLLVETLSSVFNLGYFKFSHQRNRQIIIDVFTDLCCLVVPTLAKLTKDFTERRLVKAPGSYEKLGVQVILLPSIWLGLKLRSLLRENMRITLKRLRQTSFKKRRRSTTVRIQISTMPLWVKRLFLLSHISFGIVFAVLLFVLISAGPNNCEDKLTKEIWVGIYITYVW